MKLRNLLIIALVALISTPLAAQNWRFGLHASPGISWFKTDTKSFESDGSKLTFSWGFMAEYYFAENYAIASGVDLGGYGGKTQYNYPGATINTDLRLNYIELPITVKMRTKEIGYMRYFGQFGFTPGFNLAAKADIDNDVLGVKSSKEDEDVKSDIIPLNVGLMIGLGAEYGLSGNTALVFSASFHNGFVDIADFNMPDPTLTNLDNTKSVKMMANSVRLNVGVLF